MSETYSNYTDVELFSLLKKGKKLAESAFAELYSRHSQRIYAYCLRVTGNHEDTRDIFQETFMKFYSSAKESKTIIENVPAYLLTITRNLCINYKRNKKRVFTFEDYNFVTYENGYEQKELLDLIAGALECLDFAYKEIFILRQYHGLSYKEISHITGDTVPAIKNRYWRAKEKIKGILEPYLADLSKKL